MDFLYSPAEDSFFLSEFVKELVQKNEPKTVIDMGSGSGIQAETAIKSGIKNENVVLVDINPRVVKFLKKNFHTLR